MNLILLRTPLQIFIIRELVIQKLVNGPITIIYTQQNKKNNHMGLLKDFQFEKLILINDIVKYKKINKLIQMLRLVLVARKNKYNKIYLSSIDYLPFRFLLSFHRYTEIITFDDGLGNYKKKTIYFENSDDFLDIIVRILFNVFTMTSLKNKTKKHFSILIPNSNHSHYGFTDSLEKISFDNSFNNQGDISIFIGQEWDEYKTQNDKIFEKNIIKIFEDNPVTFYITHPKEKDFSVGEKISKQIITLNGICEDFIIEVSRFSTKKIIVFSVMSTTPLIINKFKNIKSVVIYNKTEKTENDIKIIFEESGCVLLGL